MEAPGPTKTTLQADTLRLQLAQVEAEADRLRHAGLDLRKLDDARRRPSHAWSEAADRLLAELEKATEAAEKRATGAWKTIAVVAATIRQTEGMLELAEQAGALVANQPRGLRDMNEKVYTAWFPELCAPTLITRDMDGMAAFAAEHGRVVAKPLHGMGGRSIFVVDPTDKNMRVVFETLTQYGSQYAIVQRYLPEITETGDSRVLVIDGEAVPYALARMPSASDHRGNLAAGGTGVGRPLNDRDREIVARIGPVLRDAGMLFVGLDVIGGQVTEINVTSPTGVRELDKKFGTDIAGLLIDAITRRLAARH